jgi:zona occludens toxin
MIMIFMLTLITGTPGSGKTLYTLRFLKEILGTYRYVYAHGITGLSLPHEIIVCESQTCDFCKSLEDYHLYKKVKDWNKFADDGSVFFVDECQHIYRSKGSMSVTEFETHRHRGLDFYLVTQHPMLINTDLRRLVGRHIHLIADFLGRRQYEWVECSQNLSKTNALKSKYNLDKSLFALYQSATIHTKQQRKFPLIVFVMIGALLIGLYSVYSFYKRKIANKNVASQSSQPINSSDKKSSNDKVDENSKPDRGDRDDEDVKNISIKSSDEEIESLPESRKWHLVHDFDNFFKVISVAAQYRIQDNQGNQRLISSKKCRVIDFDVVCIVGHTLVAAWTGDGQAQEDLHKQHSNFDIASK